LADLDPKRRTGSDPDIYRPLPTDLDNDPDRHDHEMARVWKHINALEQDYERGERLLTGLSYAVFGLEQVKGSGLVNTVEERLAVVEKKLNQNNHALWGLLGTLIVAITVQVILKILS
jgi:hypothetical protein